MKFIIICLLFSHIASAQLMPAKTAELDIYPGNGNPTNLQARGGIAIDADSVTGRWAVCFWMAPIANEMRCQLYADSNMTLVANIQFGALPNSKYPIDIRLHMTSDGGFYLIYTDNSPMDIHLFRVDGATLAVTNLPFTNLLADSLDIAPHANGYWIGGNIAQSDYIRAFSYDLNGGSFNPIVFEPPPNNKRYCQGSMSYNSSGDIMMVWVEKDINQAYCEGEIRARVWRPDGTAVSDIIQLNMPANTTASSPDVEADADGTFVIIWSGSDNKTYSAKYSVPHGLVQSVTATNNGTRAKVGTGAFGKDFTVLTRYFNNFSLTCRYNLQLADSGKIHPIINKIGSSCDYDFQKSYDMDILQDGSIVMARITEENNQHVILQLYHHPVLAEIGGMSISEGDSGSVAPVATATITLTGPHPSGQDVSMNYYTRSDTAIENVDYVGVNGTVVITAGSTQGTVDIPIIADNIYEDSEIFSINLDAPVNTVIRTASDNIIILNDDISPPVENDCNMNFPDPCRSIAEPLQGNSAAFVINLSINQPRDRDIFIDFATVDETATAGSDYVATSGTLHTPSGSSGGDITIPILSDNENEATETLLLQLSSTATVDIPQSELRLAITEGPACELTFNQAGSVFTHTGGVGSFSMTFSHPSCMWQIDNVPPWVTVTSPLTGTGDAVVNFSVDSQAGVGMFPRIDSIVVETGPPVTQQSYSIEQEGDASLCNFGVDTAVSQIPVEGDSISIAISANDACPWEVFSSDDWVHIQSPTVSVNGNATLSINVDANTGVPNLTTPARTAILDAPFSVEIQQAGCSFSLSTSTINIDQAGGQTSVNMLAPTFEPGPCQWTAQSNQTWIVVTDGHSGSGGGLIQFDILENPSVQRRTGTVSIGDEVLIIKQEGIACNYSLSPDNIEFCPDGSEATTQIQTSDGCDWQFSGAPSWLQIDYNNSGEGVESSGFSTTENEAENNRQGTVFLNSTSQNNVAVLAVKQLGHLVFEPFSQASIPVDWQYFPSSGSWGINNNRLSADFSSGNNGVALNNSNSSYCNDCKVEAQVTLTYLGGFNALAGIVGWYSNESNHVSLLMDEIGNRWILTYKHNGIIESVELNSMEILPFQTYKLALNWDQNYIYASVNDNTILQLPLNKDLNPGKNGVFVQNTKAEFDEYKLIGTAASKNMIFKQGFEQVVPISRSACSLQ